MKKIPCLFIRDFETGKITRDVNPAAMWVLSGEGVATRKFDGTCCLIRGGRLYKRFDAKKGRVPPAGFEPAQEPDEVTGHWPGWVPVGDERDSKYHREAFEGREWTDGTYELCGPKINGNPEGFSLHTLVPHGQEFFSVLRDFDNLKSYFSREPGSMIEGIVFHHTDGRMVKIRRKDFRGEP